MIDGMKLVVLGGTVETARRVASSGWCVPLPSVVLNTRRYCSPATVLRTSSSSSSPFQVPLHKLYASLSDSSPDTPAR